MRCFSSCSPWIRCPATPHPRDLFFFPDRGPGAAGTVKRAPFNTGGSVSSGQAAVRRLGHKSHPRASEKQQTGRCGQQAGPGNIQGTRGRACPRTDPASGDRSRVRSRSVHCA